MQGTVRIRNETQAFNISAMEVLEWQGALGVGYARSRRSCILVHLMSSNILNERTKEVVA